MIDETLLARYVAGQASEAERAVVAAWVGNATERAAMVQSTQAAWERAASVRLMDASTNTPASLVNLRQRMMTSHTPLARHGIHIRLIGHLTWWGWTAAAAATVIGIGLWHFLPLKPSVPFREFATPAGARATVTLRDGSQLTLGPDTHLRVPTNFGRSTRSVELDGEAVFQVVHDNRHPFEVHILRAVVRDIGTVFDVRAYRDDDHEQVAVAEGEVAIGAAHLRARQVATIDDQARIVVQSDVDPLAYIGWRQGILTFSDSPLRDVVRQICRAYGVEIVVRDSVLARKRITSTFTNESLTDVLSLITHAVGAAYERDGHAFVIRPGTADAAGQQKTMKPSPLTTAQVGE